MSFWPWVAVVASGLTVLILVAALLWPAAEYFYLMWKGKDDGR